MWERYVCVVYIIYILQTQYTHWLMVRFNTVDDGKTQRGWAIRVRAWMTCVNDIDICSRIVHGPCRDDWVLNGCGLRAAHATIEVPKLRVSRTTSPATTHNNNVAVMLRRYHRACMWAVCYDSRMRRRKMILSHSTRNDASAVCDARSECAHSNYLWCFVLVCVDHFD